MSTVDVFDLAGPLPEGLTAIGASAGTGKTFTLAALATRMVAEIDLPIEQLLIVTYTRAAAAELRDRVRSRMAETATILADPTAPLDEPWLAALAATDRSVRAERLARAVADFDAATISTIHGFAQQVLGTLGVAAPGDPDARLVEDGKQLVRQVCTDLLVQEAVADPTGVKYLPSRDRMIRTVQRILANPGIVRVPDPEIAEPQGTKKARVGPVRAVRNRHLVDRAVDEVYARRRRAGTLAFDDLLVRLRDALDDPAIRNAVRARFRVGMVDEFQDTDRTQWQIFSQVFTGPEHRLVLVGDPKQAIYAFRGADVHTYLAAVGAAETRMTLDHNCRSDAAALDALDGVLTGATFGTPEISFGSVEPAPDHRDRRITDTVGVPVAPLSLRLAVGPGLVPEPGAEHFDTGAVTQAITEDLAAHVHHLLETVEVPKVGDTPAHRLAPRDVAILVGRHSEAPPVRAALGRHGIPATITKVGSVLESDAAMQWRWLLEAVARPADPDRARTAALSWFFAWPAQEIATASDEELGELQERLATWGSLLARRGPAAVCAQVRNESGVVARRHAGPAGDREITDLAHVAELLQVAVPGRWSPPALLDAIDALAAEHAGETEDDITARRIESEAAAVQIMTLFGAKGLEFPVVCVPMLWRGGLVEVKDVVYRGDDGRLEIDVGTATGVEWPDSNAHTARRKRAQRELRGENLRQLYVALTRARHHTAVWWTLGWHGLGNGLTRLLFARDADGRIIPEQYDPDPARKDEFSLLPDPDLATRAAATFARDGLVEVVTVDRPVPVPDTQWTDPTGGGERGAEPEIAVFDRALPRRARRWSFTGIIARGRIDDETPGVTGRAAAPGADDLEAVTDPEDVTDGDKGAGDEPTGPAPGPGDPVTPATEGAALPLGAMPAGREFGTLVHSVLEKVDFTSAALAEDLAADIAERLRWSSTSRLDADVLVAGLVAAIDSPLGPRFGDAARTLRSFPPTDRLDELAFDLRLPDDRADVAPVTMADLGALVRRYAPEGPLRDWADRCAAGLFPVDLVGQLTGSIDAVFRVRGTNGTPDRFVVCDYKTNRISGPERAPTIDDFHPDRLAEEMAHAHYVLQMLLYCVAVHRYLRWRLPDYDPATHLAGGAYLFVRGMVGPDTPSTDQGPHGVFSWDVPPELVVATSDLLAGVRPAVTP
ncbi:MAG: UvrD-helicase domain-containing protein [Actinomycetota bacterium]